MRRLCVLIPLLATGCNSLSKSVFALNLYQNGSHLHVDVVPTSGCADVSRLADVTLGGEPISYMNDEYGEIDGTGEITVNEFGVFVDRDSCWSQASFGWSDTSAFEGQEVVVMTIPRTPGNGEVSFDNWYLTPRVLTPDKPLSADTILGSTVHFAYDGPGTIAPSEYLYLGYGDLDRNLSVEIPYDGGSVDWGDDGFTITFPEVIGDDEVPTKLEFLGLFETNDVSDNLGIYIQPQSTHTITFAL